MNLSEPSYILYCINVHCNMSVFYKNNKIISALNTISLSVYHHCPICRNLLLSEIDIELEQITAEAKIIMPGTELELQRLARLN